MKDFAAGLNFSATANLQRFKASYGWLQKYLDRTRSRSVRECRKHNSVNPFDTSRLLNVIKEHLEGVDPSCIWNIDGGLLFRTTST